MNRKSDFKGQISLILLIEIMRYILRLVFKMSCRHLVTELYVDFCFSLPLSENIYQLDKELVRLISW